MVHEFKTPLNSIIGLTLNLKDSFEKLSNNSNAKLDIIQNLSNYLIFLVSDIIQYSSMSEIKFNKCSIDLKETLYFCFQILNSLLSLNKSKNENIVTELHVEESIDRINIESDEIRIKQIILNFISNSVKFTNEGKIILKAKIISLNGKFFLKISVKDTGIGIKDKDKMCLFQDNKMFENGKELNKLNNSTGSGLGLSICKMLTKKLEIGLEIKSIFKKGSTFAIVIPIEKGNFKSCNKKKVSKNNVNTLRATLRWDNLPVSI